ncbi:MAG: TSUP family transporter [Planctomycetota bacterium]
MSGALALVVIAAWFAWLGPSGAATLMASQWPIALTMAGGSFVAGVSSMGGGAVAFPVFTKVLAVPPADAKLFALLIQSLGMTAASITIFALRVPIDARALRWATAGGAAGMAAGLAWLAPLAPAAETRVLFTALQAGFAVVLLLALRRGTQANSRRESPPNDRLALLAAGLAGGVVSSLVGSGIDLVTFAVMRLRGGVGEEVATPTSVVLMAINSLVGVSAYALLAGPPPTAVSQMWLAAAPVVVVGAPLGAWVCSRLDRRTIAVTLLGLIAIEVITTLLLVSLTMQVAALGLTVAITSATVCLLMAQRRETGARRRISAEVEVGASGIPADCDN